MFEAMRRGCRMIANFFGEREPRNSKARQGRAVMPVETGDSRSVAGPTLSEIRPRVKRKRTFPLTGRFVPISGPPGG